MNAEVRFIIEHGVKILPYPTNQPVPELADAISDALRIRPEDSVDLVGLRDGLLEESRAQGRDIVNSLLKYIQSGSEEDLKSVVYPLSMKIWKKSESGCGIGRVDVNSMIPGQFREAGRIFEPGREGWRTALVPAPGLAITHSDHDICGQVMAHFFGTKVSQKLRYV